MNIHRRKKRQQGRKASPDTFAALSHDQLVERARNAGLPPFCGGWPTETLIRKIKEQENGTIQ
jgi:hypothetical protein